MVRMRMCVVVAGSLEVLEERLRSADLPNDEQSAVRPFAALHRLMRRAWRLNLAAVTQTLSLSV